MRCADARAMAIKTKQLISSILLIAIAIVCMLVARSAADPQNKLVWSNCENSEYTNGSAFQINLNQLLESLVGIVSTSGFYNSSVAQAQNSNSTVYGFAQCRGDLNSSDCKQCVENASSMIISTGTPGCNRISASILLDGCFLRYDNQSRFYDNQISAYHRVLCSTHENNNQIELVDTMLLNIASDASKSYKLFAAETKSYSSTENIYSLAQCWGDLSPTDCGACLRFALDEINYYCADEALGSQFGSVNCYLRSEVYPFFNPSPPVSEAKRSKVLQITLGVVAVTVGLIAVICLFKWKFFSRRKRWQHLSRMRSDLEIDDEGELRRLSTSIANPELIFRYDTLREATSNFNAKKKLGEGGFGSVFKGILEDGREVAVKRLKIGSSQGDAEFLNEVNLISRVQHRNLVKLLGCSVENSERLLVYEYLHNSSLDNIIFDITKRHLLDWRQRYEIIVGTARGLAYLHEESEIRIIHRDIKASNILLDNKNRPKITDFGLARLFDEDKTHVSTRVAGTFGYMAPEYAYRGRLWGASTRDNQWQKESELASRHGVSHRTSMAANLDLISETWKLYNADRSLQVIDPTLEGSYSWEEGIKVIKIGLLCTQAAAALRPSMSRVVSMLTSEREHLPSPTTPAFIDPDILSSTATSSATPNSDLYSAPDGPSSGTLEPM